MRHPFLMFAVTGLLVLGGGLATLIPATPPVVANTVEINLAEVSPKGEAGGFAIPASGNSYNCTMYGMPGTMSQGQTWSIGYGPSTINFVVYRNGVNIGTGYNGWFTDTGSSSLAPGAYTYQLNGWVGMGDHCTSWQNQCSGDPKGGYTCTDVCIATESFSDSYACSSTLTVVAPQVPKPSTPSPTYSCSADGTSVTFNYATGGATEYFLRFDNDTSAPHISELNDYAPTSWTKTGITPGQTYYFWVHAGNGGGSWSTDISDAGFTSVSPFSCAGPTPPTVDLNAANTTPVYNTATNLTWTLGGGAATSCTASNGWSGSKSTSGGTESTGNLTVSKTYTITCTGPGGSASDTVAVTPGAAPTPPTASCSALPNPADVNASVVWSSSASGGATPYSYEWTGSDSLSGSGSSVNKSYSSAGTKTAQVKVTAANGLTNGWVNCTNLTVSASPTPPTVDLNAANTTPVYNTATNLTWTLGGGAATSCTASNGWSGSKSTSGGTESTGNLTVSKTYTITCTGPGGSASDTVAVTPGGSSYDLLSTGLGIQGGATSITSGTSVTFTATTQNNSADAVGAFNDTFSYSYGGSFTPINTIAVSSLGANASRSDTSSSISFATAGNVTIRHCTDSSAAIAETNEVNNCSERLYTVSSPNAVVASCAASPNPASVNASVTWSASASGGAGGYSYQWTGSDSLSGTGSAISKSYGSAGTKTAQVRVTDSLGMNSGWKDCTALTVTEPDPPPPPPTAELQGRIGASGAWSDGPIEIDPGEELELKWDSERADSCSGDVNFSTGWADSGQTSTVTEPAAGSSISYRVICYGPGGGDQDWLVVNSSAALPTLDVSPDRVRQGETTHVGGALNGNVACTIEGKNIDPGNVDGDGDVDSLTTSTQNYDYVTGPIMGETIYTIECTGGSDSDTVRILPDVEHF